MGQKLLLAGKRMAAGGGVTGLTEIGAIYTYYTDNQLYKLKIVLTPKSCHPAGAQWRQNDFYCPIKTKIRKKNFNFRTYGHQTFRL